MPSIPWSDLRGALTDFRRTWPQLVLTDLLAKILSVVAVTPLVSLLLKLFLMTTDDGVLADADIAAFALHPIGLTAIVIVGAVLLGVWFAEQGVLMLIGFGAVEGRRVTWLDAVRYVYRYAARLVRLAGHIIARLLLVAAPFLAAVGGVYLLFLGKYDINFYL
ncbi:MAG: glycerophosphoryl diester phosphodiesterase membrane domain-containing protein, partial [Gemmatimonadota bacterium]